MASLKSKYLNLIRSQLFIKIGNKKEIFIIDDMMPSLLSPWRSYEFNELLKFFSSSIVKSNQKSFKKYSLGKSFSNSCIELENNYSFLGKKIKKLKIINLFNHKFVYLIFYHNINSYFNYFEKKDIDFFFTLYPGGGFQFNNPVINKRLRQICSSKNFLGLLVNQYSTRDYLIKEGICKPSFIHLVHGVPLNLNLYREINLPEKDFSGPLRILFMANKYTKDGADKGFPLFQQVAKELLKKDNSLRFDIVGNFEKADLISEELGDFFCFHGQLTEINLGNVLNLTHVILSPNIPFVLSEGAFDGFPLGSCVSAGLFLNVMVMTDFFSESVNSNWVDEEDFVKIEPSLENILYRFDKLLNNREKLKNLALNGKKKILEYYSYENQISPRIELFKKLLNETSC